MGANEKHDATYHGTEYTPTTDDIREIWVDRQLDHLPSEEGIRRVPETQAAFDRWLETVRTGRFSAWQAGYEAGQDDLYHRPFGEPTPNPYPQGENHA